MYEILAAYIRFLAYNMGLFKRYVTPAMVREGS